MAFAPRKHSRPPWIRFGIVSVLAALAVWVAIELGHRYLGLQKLTIEQISVTGCQGARLETIQSIARERVLGKSLFWFDADGLREAIEARPWIKSLLIRKDPPDRLSLMIEERQPLLWLARSNGIFLVDADGVVLDKLAQDNLIPMPVVVDPASQSDENLLKLIRVATSLRERQPEFCARITEFRWSARGPVAFVEGLDAPVYLNQTDPARNVPNFQALLLETYAMPTERATVRYFDLRWDMEGGYVAVQSSLETPPETKTH